MTSSLELDAPVVWKVTLDPPAIDPDRAELSLNTDVIRVSDAGIDWGQSAIDAYEAEMQRTGSTIADYRWPNRDVTIPLMVGADDSGETGFYEAAMQLRQKVALFQREGGSIQRAEDLPMYVDIVTASLTFGDQYGETGFLESNVQLILECLPDFYGDEIALDSIAATGHCDVVLTEGGQPAVIDGDHPGRCRIVVTDLSGQDQNGLFWGFRSRYYDAASTAKLFYDAGDLTALDAATVSGSSIIHSSLPGGSWCPVLLTDLAGANPMTHVGSYRVKVSCWTSEGPPQLRLLWGVGGVSNAVVNDPVMLPGIPEVYIVDLGEIRVDRAPVGAHWWHGIIQAQAAVDATTLEIHEIWLEPVDECAGQLAAVQGTSPFGVEAARSATVFANDASVGTIPWELSAGSRGVSLNPGDISEFLKATGFGFTIPSGATISGIQVNVERTGLPPLGFGGSGSIVDNDARLVKGGAVESVGDHADTLTLWEGSVATKSYGGETDMWSDMWTPAQVNDPGFGFALSAQGAGSIGGVAAVSSVQIQVFYTTAGGYTTVQDAVIYADRIAELRTEGMFRQDPSGSVYGPAADVRGDLPRIPPSGMEGRPVELLVKPSLGDLDTLPDTDTSSNPFTVQVLYRPSYIFRP